MPNRSCKRSVSLANLAPALGIVLHLFLIVPLLIFAKNSEGFATGLRDIIMLGGAAGLLFFGLLAVLWLPLPQRGRALYGAVCLGLLLCLYSQTFLITRDYGVFDGTPIRWKRIADYGLFDITLWAAIMVGAIAMSLRVPRFILPLSLLVMALETTTMGMTLLKAKPRWIAETAPPSSRENFFSFSPDKNILIIILDAFQSPAFPPILKAQPDVAESLKDFTYYRNALSQFPSTLLSFPSFLTGIPFDGSQSPFEYFNDTFKSRALPEQFARLGYNSRMASSWQFCLYLNRELCNDRREFLESATSIAQVLNYTGLFEVALFRSIPHDLKQRLYRQDQWTILPIVRKQVSPWSGLGVNAAFMKVFKDNIIVNSSKPTFKIAHILLPHLPIILNADCSPRGSAAPLMNRPFLDQATCSLRLAGSILETLKEGGIYDQTTVVIMADHGHHLNFGLPRRTTPQPADHPKVQLALPLMLVKPAFHTQEQLVQSEAPISLSDLPRTIEVLSNETLGYPGKSFMELEGQTAHTRIFNKLGLGFRAWKVVDSGSKLGDFKTFYIQGDSWNSEHWHSSDPTRRSAP